MEVKTVDWHAEGESLAYKNKETDIFAKFELSASTKILPF